MNPESRELHARFREGVQKAISAQAAFEGPPRKAIGWKEMRATWMAVPTRVGAGGLNNSSGGDPRSGALPARTPRASGPVGSGQRPVFGRPMTTWLTSGNREPGSGWRNDAEAAAANDAIREGRWADVALIRAMFEDDFGYSGDYLTPPFYWKNMVECPISGTEEACVVRLNPRPLRDITDLDPESARDYVTLEGFDPAGELFVLSAWALIADNLDLLERAYCWVTGSASDATCEINKVIRGGVRVVLTDAGTHGCVDQEVFDADNTGDFTYARSHGGLGGGTIRICNYLGGSFDGGWESMVDAFQDGNHYTAACETLWLSALLVHELGHVCGTVDADPNGAGNCYTSYMLGNTWEYALRQRYTDIAASECSGVCKPRTRREVNALFGSDESNDAVYYGMAASFEQQSEMGAKCDRVRGLATAASRHHLRGLAGE